LSAKIALAGTGNRLRRQMVDLFELVTPGPADADRLTAEALRGRAHLPGADATTVLAGISRTYRLAPHDGEGGKSDGEGTFAATHGKGEVAPIAAVWGTASCSR